MKQLIKKYIPHKMKMLIIKIQHKLIILLYYLMRILPIKENKIVISSFCGKGYGDNGKYIAEEIIKQNLGYETIWLVKDGLESIFPEEIRTVRVNSFRMIYEMTTAKIWVDNCRKLHFTRKRKGQYYIQTWHGGIPLKRIEKDIEESLPFEYLHNAKNDSKMANLFISNSKFCTDLYRRCFWYNGDILECGSPRNDIFFEKDDKCISKKVHKFFDLVDDVKIAVYAPTFRNNKSIEPYSIQYDILLNGLKEKFGGQWVILMRLHPNIESLLTEIDYNSTIMNATSYDDMQELMVASDVLITDYSSTMFEMVLAAKPVFLFAVDIDNYIYERNFYFDLYALPFTVARSNIELYNNIISFDDCEYLKGIKLFMEQLNVFENGTASSQVVKRITDVVKRIHFSN